MKKLLLLAASIAALTIAPAQAADIANKAANPFFQPYSLTKCGAYFGINTIGTGGSVNGPTVAPGTQVVQGGIGGTIGYGCPISAANQSFWFVEALADITNVNGNTNGLSLSGPAKFTERFGAGTPLGSLVGTILPASAGNPAVPNLPTLPNGITAGPGAPYGFVALHEDDVSAQVGLAQNRAWLISVGIGAGLRYRLSDGVVADTFGEYQLSSTNQVCLGVSSASCAKFGPKAVVGVQFLY